MNDKAKRMRLARFAEDVRELLLALTEELSECPDTSGETPAMRDELWDRSCPGRIRSTNELALKSIASSLGCFPSL